VARLGVGWARVRRLSRGATALTDAEWIAERDDAARRLEVRRTVALKESAEVPVAITSGWRRPFLLVGHAARLWAVERRRVVLLHELAHVKRSDWPALLVAELAVAVYWFHPLALWLGRRVRRDAEQACDELVIAAGTKPSVYAGHLLGIFRSLGTPSHPVAPALAMARPHHFEARLRAILDPREAAGPGGGRARFAIAGLVAAGAAVIVFEPGRACLPVSTASAHPAAAACSQPPCGRTAYQKVEHVSTRTEVSVRESRSVRENQENVDSELPDLPDLPEGGASLPAIWRADARSAPRAASGFTLASNSRRSPRDGSDWYDRAMKLHRKGRYDEAIADFEKAIEDGYREDAASYNIACGYALLGNKDKAFEWLHRAMNEGFDVGSYLKSDDDLESLHGDARWAELKTAAREQKSGEEKAEERRVAARYERLVAKAPKSGERFFDVGRELLRADLYDLAAQAFQASADRGHRVGTSLYNEACALSLGGKKDAALDLLQRALDAGFDQPDLFEKDDDLDNVRGSARFAALEKEAHELTLPGNGGGPFSWISRSNRSKWREAARRFATYAEAHPKSGRAWYNLGFASLAGDRAEDAPAAFQKALDLGYRKPETMYNLACAYARLDKKDTAFDWLFKALDAGFDETWTMRYDDDLDNLRGDSRYRKAVEMLRTRDRASEKDEKVSSRD
jgi:tetratricopeptide (TPR) repeat protein